MSSYADYNHSPIYDTGVIMIVERVETCIALRRTSTELSLIAAIRTSYSV